MAVEDHPKYPEWRQALEDLIDAIAGRKTGKSTSGDVARARKNYFKVADQLDE